MSLPKWTAEEQQPEGFTKLLLQLLLLLFSWYIMMSLPKREEQQPEGFAEHAMCNVLCPLSNCVLLCPTVSYGIVEERSSSLRGLLSMQAASPSADSTTPTHC